MMIDWTCKIPMPKNNEGWLYHLIVAIQKKKTLLLN